jgi:translocator protein
MSIFYFKNILKVITCIFLSFMAGFLGGIATETGTGSWYAQLEKPAFQPPGWLFGPVWTVLYILMAVAAFLIWKKGWNTIGVKTALTFYLVQLILNALWSFSFFQMESPALGLINITLLLIALIATTIRFFRINEVSGYMLIPYIIWVIFATSLNAAILLLN